MLLQSVVKKHQEESSLNVEHLFLFIIKVFGTVKPKANQVRGSRSKETFRDFLGSNIIIHRIPDGKDSVERITCRFSIYVRVLS